MEEVDLEQGFFKDNVFFTVVKIYKSKGKLAKPWRKTIVL